MTEPKPRHRSATAGVRLEEIKAAATKHFFRNGYAGTDLRMIAKDLDMHAGSLYNYIESKQELLYLILLDGMTDIHSGLDRALDGVVGPRERLKAAILFHFLHHALRRHISWTNHVEVRALTGKYREEIMAMRKDYEAKWVALVEAGMQSEDFRPLDAKTTAFGILSMAQGISRWFNPSGHLSANDMAVLYADLLMHGLCNDSRMPDIP